MRSGAGSAERDRVARRRGRRLALSAVALLLLGACSSDGDVSGDTGTAEAGSTRTARMAHVDGGPGLDPAVGWFVEAVETASAGALSIEVVYQCCGAESDVEERLVAGVAAGDFDLGWVGTRVFAGLGVPDFSPLTAPMLLDSYALQRAVLSDGVQDEMLAALDPLGVEGVAVLPGLLRRPISRDRPLRARADWEGLTVHTFRSADHLRAIASLGATPTDVGFAARNAGLDDGSIQGLENSVAFHLGQVDRQQTYLTLNVPLWARVSALIAHPGAGGLSDIELGWLRDAAAAVVARTGELADRDADVMEVVCDSGGRFALAGDDDLVGLKEAFATVYATLEDDEATSAAVRRIRRLSESTSAEGLPQIPRGCGA
jgi:TRAP-type transport system periplasmic protein